MTGADFPLVGTNSFAASKVGGPGSWPFGALRPLAYDLAMIDPPWPTQMRSPKGEAKSFARHYGAMPFEAIAALPVGQLLKRDSFLFVCCTWPLLLHGGDPKRHYKGFDAGRSRVGECIHAWGLRYVTGGAWLKTTVTGKDAYGTGYVTRSACEPFLLCKLGAPVHARRERNIIRGIRREHSRKPEEMFAWCERFMPDVRRVELFSRQNRPGWDSWGFEAGKFDAVVHADPHPETGRVAA